MSLLLVSAVVLQACAAAQGAGVPSQPAAMLTPTPNEDTSAALVSSLANAPVEGSGVLQGILFEPVAGQAEFAQLTAGGKRVLVPFAFIHFSHSPTGSRFPYAFTIDEKAASLVLNAPAYDLAAADNLAAAQQQVSAARDYWSQLPGAALPITGEGGATPPGADAPIAFQPRSGKPDFVDGQGARLGSVGDMILSTDGAVLFLLLTPDPALGLTGPQVPVPYKSAAWDPSRAAYKLLVPAQSLKDAPVYDPEGHPVDFSIPGWDQSWSEYWKTQGLQDTPTPDSNGAAPQPPSSLAGEVVAAGSRIGAVADWIFDLSGNSQYVILSASPLAQPQDAAPAQARAFIPIPWTALTWDADQGDLVFQPAAAVLRDAPDFQSLVAMLTGDWLVPVVSYWRQFIDLPAPVDAAPDNRGWFAASELRGHEVLDPAKDAIGQVLDITLDPGGAIRYVVVSKSAGTVIAIPWANFSFDPQAQTVLYIDDPLLFENAPAFRSVEEVKKLSSQAEKELRTYWGLK